METYGWATRGNNGENQRNEAITCRTEMGHAVSKTLDPF